MYDLEFENSDSVFRMEEGTEEWDIRFGHNTLDFSKHFMPKG